MKTSRDYEVEAPRPELRSQSSQTGWGKALLAEAAELISERNKEPERQRSRTACKTPAHGWPAPPLRICSRQDIPCLKIDTTSGGKDKYTVNCYSHFPVLTLHKHDF